MGIQPVRIASIVLALFLTAAALTGCWDKVEIEQRAFILVIGLDKFDYNDIKEKEEEERRKEQESIEKGQQDLEEKSGAALPEDSPQNRITLTIVFPNVGLLSKQGGLVPEEPKFPLSIVGPNLFESISELATRVNKTLSFGHTKAVLIGEELARDKQLFTQVLDELAREQAISRNIYFAIVKGKAKDAIFIKPLYEPIVGRYIEEIFRKRRETGRFHGKKLGEVMIYMHKTGDGLTPRIIPGDSELKVAGGCIIKDFRYIGDLGEVETRACELIDNMFEGGVVTIDVNGVSVPFSITGASRKFNIREDGDGQIHLDVILNLEGDVEGYVFHSGQELMDNAFIRRIEHLISQHISQECSDVMNKMQQQFGVDIWGIAEHIRKFHPDLWIGIKDRWDAVFPDIQVHFTTEAKVRRIGIVK